MDVGLYLVPIMKYKINLNLKDNILQNIENFFHLVIVKAISNEATEGCLLVKTQIKTKKFRNRL